MLGLSVSVEGDKVVINDLQQYAKAFPSAINRGLSRAAIGIERAAFEFLSGPGGRSKKKNLVGPVKGSTGFTKKSGEQVDFSVLQGAGAYPVPVRTGNLRRLLNWLKPGESKTGPAGTFTAGSSEVVVYNSALYAHGIHEGTGSSAKFGPRHYLTDGLDRFNQGDRISGIIEEEIQKEINKRG